MLNPILLAVFAAVALVCACLAIVSTRKSLVALNQARELVSALRLMRSKVEAHDSEIERLADDFRTLRGKFYASRRKSDGESETSADVDRPTRSVADLKAHLRQQVGLMPGRAK